MAQQEGHSGVSYPQRLVCSGHLTVGAEWDMLQNRHICHFTLLVFFLIVVNGSETIGIVSV